MDPQPDFFTLQSLATFAGTVGAVTVVSNGCQRAFGFNPSWFALALAEVICLGIVAIAHGNAATGVTPPLSDYFVAILNGFLVFCSASGAANVGSTATGGDAKTVARSAAAAAAGKKPTRRFWARWP